MQLDHVDEFLDLADTLSFTRSAENLCISQPTLSRHIAELERQIGARLFDRSTNSVRLTRAGRTFYQAANAMRMSYDEALSSIKDANAVEYQRILCGGSTIHPAVNRTLTKLASRAVIRDLPIRFEYGHTRPLADESPSRYSLDMLKDGDLDLVIEPQAPDALDKQDFEAVRVAREPFVVLALAANPLAARHGLKLEDLADQSLTILALFPHCPMLMTYPFRAAGIRPRDSKTIFIGNILEVSEHLAELADDEIVLMQEGFYRSFGFAQEGLGHNVALDMADDRLTVEFYALMRKVPMTAAMRSVRAMLDEIAVA